MVSPDIEVLSVFMTPWMNPTSSQRATRSACSRDHGFQKRMIGALGIGRLRIMPADDVIRQPPHALGIAARREILERADANMAGSRRGSGQPRATGSRASHFRR